MLESEPSHLKSHGMTRGVVLAMAMFTVGGICDAALAGEGFEQRVVPFFKEHCFECHDEDLAKGDLRLDELKSAFESRSTFGRWVKIHDKISREEMPPPDKPRPTKEARAEVVDRIATGLRDAEKARRKVEGRARLRRLSRAEYENTVQDILAVNADLAGHLPEDPIVSGFDKAGASLNLSSMLLERYMEAADIALDAAIVHGPQPARVQRRFSYLNDKAAKYPNIYLLKPDAVVFFASGYSPTQLEQFRAPSAGSYRFRISAYAWQSRKPVVYRVFSGDVANRENEVLLVDHFEANLEPGVSEFVTWLDEGESILIVPYGTGHDFRRIHATEYKGAGLAVQWVEVEGPLHDRWPPESHRRLFGALPETDLDRRSSGSQKDEARFEANARGLIDRFLPSAFRRPVADKDSAFFLELYRARRTAGDSFEQAMRTIYRTALCSPEVLLLPEEAGPLDEFAVASRLSYFLWNSPPDARLRGLAGAGELRSPETLRAEVERLLDHPRSRGFVRDFLGQWLELRDIDSTTPDDKLYPEFDKLLQISMTRETELFFEELLKGDLSLLNCVDSDFSMLNERLANHYGIAGVEGLGFRRVPLPKGSHRGGLMTHASVLKVTANGTTTSPVLRGVWALERLLGETLDPPPSNVPALEPDIRGAANVRQQVARHRELKACARCHDRIDPVGFALENFDVIGGWRERYRSVEQGEAVAVVVRGEKAVYRLGPAVESADVTADGRRFANIDEFKAVVLENPDKVAANLAGWLMTYATGEGISFSDRAAIERIVAKTKERNYGLRSLVHEIVQSDRFLNK